MTLKQVELASSRFLVEVQEQDLTSLARGPSRMAGIQRIRNIDAIGSEGNLLSNRKI